jgi:hypothetical protein
MTWRVAYSLDKLLQQLNSLAPNRSRASDGSIGDAAHQAEGSASDHNPWYGPGIVTARDFTHDPAGGLDCNKLAAALIASRDPRIKYLIWQGRIVDSRPEFRPWTWQPSSGHYQHLHLSVMATASADDARPWSLPGLTQEDDVSEQDAYNGFRRVIQEAAEGRAADVAGQLRTILVSGPIPAKGDKNPEATTSIELEASWNANNFRQVNTQLAALVALATADRDVTPEQLNAMVDTAVAKHTPTAEQVAAAQLPHIQEAVREVLGEDNEEQADAIVLKLGEKLAQRGAA